MNQGYTAGTPARERTASLPQRERRQQPGAESSPRRQQDRTRFAEYARTRCVRLRNELVLENERLVHYLASRFRPVGSISLEDLVQVSHMGLISAIERYDPECGTSFVAYAAPTIVGVIKHYLRDQSWGVKVPRRIRELATRLRRLREDVEQQLGGSPTPAELAAYAGVFEEEILEAMEADALYFTVSLDAQYHGADDEQTASYQGLLGVHEPAYGQLMTRDAVYSMLEQLDARQRAIIEARFFRDRSQGQVAAELGISQMHVSRLERQSLRKLRELLREHGVIE